MTLSPEYPLPPGHSLRVLCAADLPALRSLNREVQAALSDATAFRLFGGAEDFFATHLGPRGMSVGIFDGDVLCAYSSVTRPRADDLDNYACDLHWPAERAGRVALLSAAMVAPAYRGRGLHAALIAARLALAAQLGHGEALARAAPGNERSRRNLLAAGFVIIWLGTQAEGSLRHIYWRPTAGAVGRVQQPIIWVSAANYDDQQAKLAQGLVGVAERADNGEAIGFAAVV